MWPLFVCLHCHPIWHSNGDAIIMMILRWSTYSWVSWVICKVTQSILNECSSYCSIWLQLCPIRSFKTLKIFIWSSHFRPGINSSLHAGVIELARNEVLKVCSFWWKIADESNDPSAQDVLRQVPCVLWSPFYKTFLLGLHKLGRVGSCCTIRLNCQKNLQQKPRHWADALCWTIKIISPLSNWDHLAGRLLSIS